MNYFAIVQAPKNPVESKKELKVTLKPSGEILIQARDDAAAITAAEFDSNDEDSDQPDSIHHYEPEESLKPAKSFMSVKSADHIYASAK